MTASGRLAPSADGGVLHPARGGLGLSPLGLLVAGALMIGCAVVVAALVVRGAALAAGEWLRTTRV